MASRARVSTASSRPSGTDGMDHPFRMTIDNRYRKAAEKKFQLQKLLIAQTVFHLLKASTVILMAMKGDDITSIMIGSCAFGGAAVLSGTVGLRKSSSGYLNVFLFSTCATVVLSLVPFLSGSYYSKVFKSLDVLGMDMSYKPSVINGLEVAQECIGVILQLVEIRVSLSLLQYISRKSS